MRLSEIKNLREDALETKVADDLWDESGADSAEYVSTTEYVARPVKDSKPTVYEVFKEIGDERKPFGKFTAGDLAKTLTPIRPNQTPDAEGFISYVDPAKVEAFQYSGEPCKLDLDGKQAVQLNRGDYVLRTVSGSSFKYTTETGANFEATLKKD